MVPLPKKTIEHFTHPNHQLVEISDDKEYLCDGCKTYGIGNRFRCHGCDFDLHEYCGTCPMTLSSFMHPQHQLHIVLRQPQATCQNDRFCDVCGDSVEGLFYGCKICEFDVHPLCTQLPKQVPHFLHPAHPLTLQQFPPSWCLFCKNNCTSWRYGCSICCVDIHLECLLTAFDTLTSTSTSSPPPVPRSVWQPSAPAAAPRPAFGTYVYQIPPFDNAYVDGVQAPPAFGAYGYQISPFGNAYADGVQATPAFGAYDCQPPLGSAYASGVQAPAAFGACGYQLPPFGSANSSGVQAPAAFGAYGYQLPPFGSANSSGVQAPPAFGAHGYEIRPFGSVYAYGVQDPPVGAYIYQYGMPFGSCPSNMHHHQHPSGNQQDGQSRFRKRMYRILGSLSLGVFSNGLSDFIFGD